MRSEIQFDVAEATCRTAASMQHARSIDRHCSTKSDTQDGINRQPMQHQHQKLRSWCKEFEWYLQRYR